MDCFEFKLQDYNLGEGWQYTTHNILSGVKQDFRSKSKLVTGGNLIDMIEITLYSSTVNRIRVQLLHVITQKAYTKQLCGNIMNYFPNAYTKKMCLYKN